MTVKGSPLLVDTASLMIVRIAAPVMPGWSWMAPRVGPADFVYDLRLAHPGR
jgi:hypothetical protein